MKKQITINIGESYASREPTVIYTLLGSCVAVCLYDPTTMIGGMNHILLPGKPDIQLFNDSARYGINAMDILISKIMKLGGNRRFLTAKAYGGAHIIPEISLENGVGRRLVVFIKDFLETERITLVSHDLEGFDIRKVFFQTATGEVALHCKKRTGFTSFILKEKKCLKKIREQSQSAGGCIYF